MMSEIHSEALLVCFSIDTIDSIYKTTIDSNKIFWILEKYMCNKNSIRHNYLMNVIITSVVIISRYHLLSIYWMSHSSHILYHFIHCHNSLRQVSLPSLSR